MHPDHELLQHALDRLEPRLDVAQNGDPKEPTSSLQPSWSQNLDSVAVLFGGIAHDLNNLLAVVIRNIDLTRRSAELQGGAGVGLDVAVKASERAADLVRQLMTFSSGGEPAKEAADVARIVRESATFSQYDSKANCRIDIPEDLWRVDADSGQICQVVQNLIINAQQAMPAGGDIEVICRNVPVADRDVAAQIGEGPFVKIVVEDTGIGIPAELLGKVFEPYFTTKDDGSGLGLAIAHAIIKRHGGHIAAGARRQGGTSFTLYLPRAASSEPATRPKAVSLVAREANAVRIMVMDDEEAILQTTKRMLETLGYEVIVAEDGHTAVRMYEEALASERAIDLVIMDLTIREGMGGREAVGEVLALDPDARVIASSGDSEDQAMVNFLDYGFRGAVRKPYSLDSLASEVSSALGHVPGPENHSGRLRERG